MSTLSECCSYLSIHLDEVFLDESLVSLVCSALDPESELVSHHCVDDVDHIL